MINTCGLTRDETLHSPRPTSKEAFWPGLRRAEIHGCVEHCWHSSSDLKSELLRFSWLYQVPLDDVSGSGRWEPWSLPPTWSGMWRQEGWKSFPVVVLEECSVPPDGFMSCGSSMCEEHHFPYYLWSNTGSFTGSSRGAASLWYGFLIHTGGSFGRSCYRELSGICEQSATNCLVVT